MAENPKKKIQDVNEELGYLEDQLLSIADRLSNTIKSAITDIKDEAAGVNEIFSRNLSKSIKEIARESDKILGNTLKLAQGSAKLSDIKKSEYTIQLKQLSAQRNLDALYNAGLLTEQEKLKAETEISEAVETQNILLKDQVTYATQIQKNMGITGKILQGISKIPILGNFIDAEEALAKAQLEASKEGANTTKVLGTAFKSLGNTLKTSLSDPLIASTFYIGLATKAFKALYDIGVNYSKITAQIAKNQAINSSEAKITQDRLRGIASASRDTLMTTNNLVEATNQLNDAFGTSADFSSKTLSDNLKLTKNLGLTVDEAAEYAKLSTLTGQTQEEIVNFIGKQRKGVISNKKVLSEVAKVNGQLFAQYKGSPALISQAIIKTQKLGMTIQQAQNASKQLLNFEESISAELEAELLTGKDINLEKARYLALQGDSAGAAQELIRNVGSLADFQKLNVIQQEALAKAVGMTTDELTDSLVKSEQIKRLDQDQVKLYQSQIKELRDKGQIEKANALEQQMLNGKSLELANIQADAQERLTRAGEKFKDSLASIVAGPAGALLEKVATVAEQLAGSPLGKIALTTVAVTALAGGIATFAKIFGSIAKNGAVPVTIQGGGSGFGGGGTTSSGTGGGTYRDPKTGRFAKAPTPKGGSLSRGLGRGLGKGLGKGLVRGIPYAGALLGAGAEFAEGGLTMESAGRAALSGGLGFLGGAVGSAILPGAGTIGGAVGGSMAGDYLGDLIFGEREEMANGGIVTKPTRALVGEAGAEAVIPLDKLMAEFKEMRAILTQIANKEGTVYLDGTKVGTAMAMSTYKTQ
jgi:hypothetical protein